MLIKLAISVCMLSAPTTCKDIDVFGELPEGILPNGGACMMLGQLEAAKYIEQHPGWKVTRFSCVPQKSVE